MNFTGRALPRADGNSARRNVDYGQSTTDNTIGEFDPRSAFCETVRFLMGRHGFSDAILLEATERARMEGATGLEALLISGSITEDVVYAALAAHLGVQFIPADQLGAALAKTDTPVSTILHAQFLHFRRPDGTIALALAPQGQRLLGTLRFFSVERSTRDFVITTPTALRGAIEASIRYQLLAEATHNLHSQSPVSSARNSGTFYHGIAVSILCMSLFIAMIAVPSTGALFLHIFFAAFFLFCVILRLLALRSAGQHSKAALPLVHPRELPRYDILVALRDEAAVVPQLLSSLSQINWPATKLRIHLLCEEDDSETVAAIEKARPDKRFHLIIVPKAQPMTKPKALQYGLAFTDAPFVAVYDAEDRPHPDQLLEAYACFQQSANDVACVQAPLAIANLDNGKIPALFHLEYAGLFRGLLPWLDRKGFPLLLGGTSNHFKTAAIRQCGGWDPYNVTEDADLGLRLYRNGFHTRMISRPTLEDAPENPVVWLKQRTRWFKGWMQTILVHTRQNRSYDKPIDLPAFTVTALLLAGTVISALVHPFFVMRGIFNLTALSNSPWSGFQSALAWLDWSTIIISYVAFYALCWRATRPVHRVRIGWQVLLVPVYWLGLSIAAWRAVYQMFFTPHLWEKTPHLPSERNGKT